MPLQGKAPRYRDLRDFLREVKADSNAFLTVWVAHGKAYLSALAGARCAAETGAVASAPESTALGSGAPPEV